MTADAYRDALDRLGLSQVGAAKFFGVNPRTSRRWALGEQEVPRVVELALEFMIALGPQKIAKILKGMPQ